jgi:hypothetical protein
MNAPTITQYTVHSTYSKQCTYCSIQHMHYSYSIQFAQYSIHYEVKNKRDSFNKKATIRDSRVFIS